MAIDIRRIAQEVAEKALQSAQPPPPQPEPKKPHLTTGRAILLGAGLFTAGRALAKTRGQGMLDSLRELAEPGHDGDQDYDEEPEAEEEEDFDDEDYDDQPEAEEDEDFDDEDFEDEPEAEEDEDYDDEPEAEEDEDFEEEDEEEAPPRRRARSRSGSRGRG